MTDFKGYLDRLRENVEVLDEAIATARTHIKTEKGADSRIGVQWLKMLRDLVELRNQTLVGVKTHILGRDSTGTPNEPPDHYSGNGQIEFEREFNRLLSPWTREDLLLKCQDCSMSSEEVSQYTVKDPTQLDAMGFNWLDVNLDLCPTCYAKHRQTNRELKEQQEKEDEEEDDDEGG